VSPKGNSFVLKAKSWALQDPEQPTCTAPRLPTAESRTDDCFGSWPRDRPVTIPKGSVTTQFPYAPDGLPSGAWEWVPRALPRE